jgi:hypothetical protein
MIFAILLAAGVCRAQAPDIAGDWQGTIDTGMGQLHLVMHLTRASDGALQATLDSVDQGAHGIPVSSVTFKDGKLTLDVSAVHGTYEGRVAADGKAISGTWSQGKALPLDFKRWAAPAVKTEPKPAKPSEIDGAWMGSLDTGAIKLRVVFRIVNTEDGLTATLDSPDQGVKGIAASSVKREGSSLKIEAASVGGAFAGKIAADFSSIEGTWTQGGGTAPLALKRVKDEAELQPKRPQNPVKPYPYREEEVGYDSSAAKLRLAGTLTIPEGKGPLPAVLLISGSGPHDRDETLMGHKPFLVLSDYLTRHGIAVLRVDNRGVGKSTGTFANATTADLSNDAEAGFAYLKTRAEIDPHRIGLIGHSEGGIIAPMIAARNREVAFVVMMAGTGVPGDQVLAAQVEAIAVAGGKSPEKAAQAAAAEREFLKLVEAGADQATLEKMMRAKMADDVPEGQVEMQAREITSPWFRYFLTYDPATALRKVTCPLLAINGSKDTQVLPAQNLPAIRKALQEGGNQRFEVDELPGLNHLFQTAKTGSPAEYAQIEETMSRVALEKIASWIAALNAPPAKP